MATNPQATSANQDTIVDKGFAQPWSSPSVAVSPSGGMTRRSDVSQAPAPTAVVPAATVASFARSSGRIADRGPHGRVVVVERSAVDNERGVVGSDARVAGCRSLPGLCIVAEGARTDMELEGGAGFFEGLLSDGLRCRYGDARRWKYRQMHPLAIQSQTMIGPEGDLSEARHHGRHWWTRPWPHPGRQRRSAGICQNARPHGSQASGS